MENLKEILDEIKKMNVNELEKAKEKLEMLIKRSEKLLNGGKENE